MAGEKPITIQSPHQEVIRDSGVGTEEIFDFHYQFLRQLRGEVLKVPVNPILDLSKGKVNLEGRKGSMDHTPYRFPVRDPSI